MKFRIPAIAILCLIFSSGAFAWNCSDPLASRVDVGTTKPSGAPGNGDGQYFLGTGSEGVKGDYYVCQVPKTPITTPTQQNQNQSQTSNNTNTNTSKSSSTSTSSSKSDSNSSSKSAVTNSGNSSATGGNASASNNSSGNVSTYSSNEVYNEARQNPGAFAPTAAFTTSPCSKGFSGGGSTPSISATLGIVLTDKGCDSRQTALNFYAIGNPTAAARVLCSTSASKRAHLSLSDCLLLLPPVVIAPPAPVVSQPAPTPTIVIIPAPQAAAEVHTEIVKQTAKLIEVGECKFVLAHSTGKGCSTTLQTLSPTCIALLDRAISKAGPDDKIVLTGPTYIARAARYVKSKLGTNSVIFNVQQQDSMAVQVYSVN